MTRHIFKRFPIAMALLVVLSAVTACGSTDDQSSTANPTNIVGRTMSAAIIGTTQDILDEGAWSVDVSEVLWLRDEIYTERGTTVPLATIEVGMEVPVFVDVDLKRGQSYVFIASHVEVGGPVAKVSAHGILEVDSMDQVQTFDPPLSMLLYDGEADTVASQLSALVELLDEKWDGDRSERLGAEAKDDPRTRQALLALDQLGLTPTTYSLPADYDDEVGMSVAAYLKLPADQRQLSDFEDMPVRAIEELDLARVYTLVVIPANIRDSFWSVGIRTDVGTFGPYGIGNNAALEMSLPAPIGGGVELVVWEDQPDLTGSVSVLQQATAIDLPALAIAGDALVVSRDSEALIIDIGEQTMTWVSLDEATRLWIDIVSSDG